MTAARRALTCWQPWGSLIMAGIKNVENRPRPVPSTLPQWYRCTGCGHRDRVMPSGGVHSHFELPDAREVEYEVVPDGPYPFRLWIHAAKGWDQDGWLRAWDLIGYDALMEHVYPPGALLGSVLVTGCHYADDVACWGSELGHLRGEGDDEREFCSPWAQPDCYHITVTDPQPLPEPIPMRGRQGWWILPDDALASLDEGRDEWQESVAT